MLSSCIRNNIDGQSIRQPTDSSIGRHRPASGWGEIEDINRYTIRLFSQGLVEKLEVGNKIVNSYK